MADAELKRFAEAEVGSFAAFTTDFNLFWPFKNFLSRRTFEDKAHCKQLYSTSHPLEQALPSRNVKLVRRWDKFLNSNGGYVKNKL
jgi:hypothetical protein